MNLTVMRCGLLICCVILCTSCVHVGQRLLHIEIEVDGQVVCDGIRGVRDDMPVDDMWYVLDTVPFESTGVTLAPENGSTWDLEGEVVVRIKHVENELATASLSNLSLTRDGSGWILESAEVDRIAQAP